METLALCKTRLGLPFKTIAVKIRRRIAKISEDETRRLTESRDLLQRRKQMRIQTKTKILTFDNICNTSSLIFIYFFKKKRTILKNNWTPTWFDWNTKMGTKWIAPQAYYVVCGLLCLDHSNYLFNLIVVGRRLFAF